MEENKNRKPDTNRNDDKGTLRDDMTGSVTHTGSASTSGASNLDEKTSTMGRRDKGTGLATKDGLTGSDYDGQLSE